MTARFRSVPARRASVLVPLALFLPVPMMVAASLWLLEPMLLWLLGVLFCLCLFVSTLFARNLRMIFLGITVVAMTLSIALSNWPLRLTFLLARPTFDQLADDVRTGNLPPMPCRIGLFRIRKAEVYRNNVVCFWTDVNPGGNCGFAQCEPADPPFNLWSHIPLDDSWQFICED